MNAPTTTRTTTAIEPPALVQRLAPVREALLADASEEADRLRAEARDDAGRAADAAERDVAAEVAEIERRQAVAREARAERVRARARAEAQALLLAARDDVHRELRAATRAAALQLRDDDRYPALLDRLETMVRDQLGPDARIERDPPDVGGVVGTAGTRRVDYTLTVLAERALRDRADEVISLWT